MDADILVETTYLELRKIARCLLCNEKAGHTLQATALVHEGLIRVLNGMPVEEIGRAGFLRLVALSMRRVLVDHARAKLRQKRGAGGVVNGLENLDSFEDTHAAELVVIDEALKDLERLDPFKAAVVNLHYFSGLTVQETAEALECSTATVTRHWRNARAWLLQALSG